MGRTKQTTKASKQDTAKNLKQNNAKISKRRGTKASEKTREATGKNARPGRWVPNEMIKLQREVKTQIPRSAILRVIKEFCQELPYSEKRNGLLWQKKAIENLHAVSEAFLEETLEDANSLALGRRVVSPASQDIALALKVRWGRHATPCSNLWHDYKDWFKKLHKLTDEDVERIRNKVLARQRAKEKEKEKAKAVAGKQATRAKH